MSDTSTRSAATSAGTAARHGPARRGRRRIGGGRAGYVASLVVLGVGALGMVVPFLWMISTSLLPSTRAYDLPPHWIPVSVRGDNYVNAVTGPVPFLRTMGNSALIAISVTLAQVVLCPMAGYAFARLRFPGRNALFVTLLASLMVPAQVTIIPLYLLMRDLHLLDNPLSLILPSLTGAFGVFLMRQFFLGLPQSLLEAAEIDGCGPFKAYRLIALPLAKPGLSALGVITFLTSWNAYFAPSVFLNSVEHSTMPLALVLMLGPFRTGDIAMIMAATTLAILPAFLVYLVAQRWVIESLTQSGIKG